MSPEPKPDGSRKRDDQAPGQVYREVAPYLTMGIQLAASVVVFFLIGWWLDTRYGTAPTYKLIGLVLGSVGGMIKFLRSVVELSKKEESS